MVHELWAEQSHWSECGRSTSFAESSVAGRPHRSVQSFGGERTLSLEDRFTDRGPRGIRGFLFVYLAWFAVTFPSAVTRPVVTAFLQREGPEIFDRCTLGRRTSRWRQPPSALGVRPRILWSSWALFRRCLSSDVRR